MASRVHTSIGFRKHYTQGMQTRGVFFKPGFMGLAAFKPGEPGFDVGL